MSPKTHLVTNLFANLDKADFRKFKVKFHLWLGLILSTHSGQSLADLVLISPYEPVSMAIDKTTGSLIQLPGSVKTITPSTQFEITDVASEVDEVSGMKSNVRLLQVRPLPGAKSETVTFVLGNGKSIKSVLMVAEGAQKHYELVYPPETKKLKNPKFLQSEMDLMGAMIRGDSLDYVMQMKDKKIPLKGLEGFSARLQRLWAGSGLTGMVLEIRNTSSEAQSLDITHLKLMDPQNGQSSLGTSAGALFHAERLSLEPCGLLFKPQCTTLLYVVTRSAQGSSLGGLEKKRELEFPWVKESNTNEIQNELQLEKQNGVLP